MRPSSTVALCSVLASLSAGAFADTPAGIFEKMDSARRASFKDVDEYSEMKITMGMCTLEYFEKESTQSVDGRGTVEYMRLIPISEVMERKDPDSPFAQATPEDLEYAAKELRREGSNVDLAMNAEIGKVGVPPMLGNMLMNPPPGKPWLSPKPGDMMNNYAMMLEGVAKSKKENKRLEEAAEEEARTDPLAEVAALTRIVGNETFNSRPAIHLVAEDLYITQSSDDDQFVLNTMHLWVDAEKYVPLKMRMDGVATHGGESREMRIEREDTGYGSVDGCKSMYEPVRSVMRMSGVLSPQEQAQMDEAKEKLEQFKMQLASMPQAQQDMIKRQMGPQMEMMEKMASGQGIEVESLVVGRRCNAGPPTRKEYMQTVPGISQAACIGFKGD